MVAPYSPRARPGLRAAAPIAWDELTGDLRPDAFTVETIAHRLANLAKGPWALLETLEQRLPDDLVES